MRKIPPEILLYTHAFAGGGAERVVIQLANHWAENGRSILMAVNLDEGPLRHELSGRVDVVSLDRKMGLTAAPALARLISERRPRAVAAAMTVQNIAAAAAVRLSRWKPRLLVTEHNHFSTVLSQSGRLRRSLLPILMRMLYPGVDVVSAVSSVAAADLDARLGRPEGATATLYNPIWPPATTPGAEASEIHPWFAESTPVLLTVGRLHPQKNHANLLDALAIAQTRRPLRLIVLGEGPLRESLEAKAEALSIADAVDFVGFRRNVGDFLSRADVFVLSSDFEGLPLSLMESLATGTPAVSTDCPSGPSEVLDGGRYGRLVPVRDPEALAEGIIATLQDPPAAEALKARARDFSIEAVAARYERLLFGDPNA